MVDEFRLVADLVEEECCGIGSIVGSVEESIFACCSVGTKVVGETSAPYLCARSENPSGLMAAERTSVSEAKTMMSEAKSTRQGRHTVEASVLFEVNIRLQIVIVIIVVERRKKTAR